MSEIVWTEGIHQPNGRKMYISARFLIHPHGAKRFLLFDKMLLPQEEAQLTPKPTSATECKAVAEAVAEETLRNEAEHARNSPESEPLDDMNGDPEPWLTAEKESVPTITDPEDGLICGCCGRGHHGMPCPHVPNAITVAEKIAPRPEEDAEHTVAYGPPAHVDGCQCHQHKPISKPPLLNRLPRDVQRGLARLANLASAATRVDRRIA